MRILLLNHNLRERGTWFRAWEIARELARRGHRPTLWTAAPQHYYRRTSWRRDGVEVIEWPSWAPLAGADDGWGPLDCAGRAMHMLGEPFDLCYAFAHPPNVWLPAWIARRLRRRPLLYDWCDWYAGGVFPRRRELRASGRTRDERWFQPAAERIETRLERRMPRLAGRVTVISELLRREAGALGRRPDEILVLPNGVDLEAIRPLERGVCRRAFGLPAKAPLLVYTANYHPDQELLLRSVAAAASAAPGLRLVYTGPPFDEALVGELALEGALIALGKVPHERIPTLLGAADALALPLADTPFNRSRMPFKFTEYLAAGRPIVTNPVGDLEKWFAPAGGEGEPIGRPAPPQPEAYGRAMAEVLRPGETRERMGRAARALAEREFGWARQVDRLETFVSDWLA